MKSYREPKVGFVIYSQCITQVSLSHTSIAQVPGKKMQADMMYIRTRDGVVFSVKGECFGC